MLSEVPLKAETVPVRAAASDPLRLVSSAN